MSISKHVPIIAITFFKHAVVGRVCMQPPLYITGNIEKEKR
ncbi:Uncharacterised protein [Serratia liquefaciens]|nr:Uncharacterised protein [Serratia liquefaciens]